MDLVPENQVIWNVGTFCQAEVDAIGELDLLGMVNFVFFGGNRIPTVPFRDLHFGESRSNETFVEGKYRNDTRQPKSRIMMIMPQQQIRPIGNANIQVVELAIPCPLLCIGYPDPSRYPCLLSRIGCHGES